MTADELLAKLEKGDLVSPEIIATLRKQVAAAKEPIAPAAITKLLVEKGHLTAGQAARLVDATTPSQIAKKPAAPATASQIAKAATAKAATPSAIQKTATAPAKTPAATHNSSVHDDLGLAPLEELENTATLAAPSSPTLKVPQPAAPAAPAKPTPKAAPEVAP
jgi:hypothetical protein